MAVERSKAKTLWKLDVWCLNTLTVPLNPYVQLSEPLHKKTQPAPDFVFDQFPHKEAPSIPPVHSP